MFSPVVDLNIKEKTDQITEKRSILQKKTDQFIERWTIFLTKIKNGIYIYNMVIHKVSKNKTYNIQDHMHKHHIK